MYSASFWAGVIVSVNSKMLMHAQYNSDGISVPDKLESLRLKWIVMIIGLFSCVALTLKFQSVTLAVEEIIPELCTSEHF